MPARSDASDTTTRRAAVSESSARDGHQLGALLVVDLRVRGSLGLAHGSRGAVRQGHPPMIPDLPVGPR
jgi:hypothetical protein